MLVTDDDDVIVLAAVRDALEQEYGEDASKLVAGAKSF